MSTGVIITAIICGTIVLLSLIAQIAKTKRTKELTDEARDIFEEDK